MQGKFGRRASGEAAAKELTARDRKISSLQARRAG
jgi:hypothetical protein